MQPHTGAVVTVLNYLGSSIFALPDNFAGKTIELKTYCTYMDNKKKFEKFHTIKTIRHNRSQQTLEFEVGKDYRCFLVVRYDSKFEKFDFINHTHTYTREEFTLYQSGEYFSGEYVSESGYEHKITGRKMTRKRLTFEDTFKDDKNPSTKIGLKYDIEILSVTSN